MHLAIFVLFSTLLCQCSFSADQDFNPYEVLGIPRTASEKDIRQAYKKLARHWHPDKNSEPNAHEQFTKINAAYEILSDSTKRQNYDEYGTTSQDNQRGFNTNHFRDPFDIFRAHFGGDFHFFREAPTGARKIIHVREFLSDILPNSDRKPYLLFGSTNFCFQCRQALATFRSLESQLNDVGIGTAEFNVNDQRLSNELGILNAPSLCVVSQRRVYHFDDQGKINSYSESNIKEFLRKSIPIQRYIQTLNNLDDLNKIISTSNQTNRVQAILFTKQKVPTLKFVIPCLQHLSRLQCSLINSSVIINGQIPPYLRQISPNADVVFLFKEDRNPVAIIRDGDLTFTNIQKQFESNQLLHLPTISSAHVFNMICQTNSVKPCFLLIGDRNLFETARSAFLQLAQQFFQQSGSRLAFLDTSVEQQNGFQKIFASLVRPNEKKLFIIVARRWLDNTIEIVNTEVEFDENSLQEFRRNHLNIIADIEANLKLFLNARWQNAKKYPLPVIYNFDQRQENLFRRVFDFIEDKWNYYFERNPILRSLSGYFLAYQLWIFLIPLLIYCRYSGREADSSSSLNSRSFPRPSDSRASSDHRDSFNAIQVNEFDAPFLQRYLQTGAPNVILILLIADKSTDEYIGYFRRQISLIKDSRMVFAVLYREHSPRWLNELYANIESDQKTPNVRCGPSTVLALYIRRKFFVPYWSLINTDEHHVDESGAYLGMDHHYRSSSTSSNDSCTTNSESLSFSDWIDQLLDGNIRRPISISEWPLTFR